MKTTPRGLKISTDSVEACVLIHKFEEELLGYRQGGSVIFEAIARDPECAIAHAYGAVAHLFALTRTASRRAVPHLVRAAASRADTRRERLIVAGVQAWADEATGRSINWLEEALREEPRDLFAGKLLQYLQFSSGRSHDMLRTASMLVDRHPFDGRVHAMHAFALAETGDAHAAERAARLGIAIADDPWAHHAIAHVFDLTGRVGEGAKWLEDHSHAWAECSSFLYTHNWWHAALAHIELGDLAQALDVFDRHLWSRRRDYCQDQVNAVSLLLRLELAGCDVADRWQSVAAEIVPFARDAVDGFVDLHYAYALARAGQSGALANLRAAADANADPAGPSWRLLMPRAITAVIAHADGDHRRAARLLGGLLDQLQQVGGSVVQRDLFTRVTIDSMLRSADVAGARDLARRATPAIRRHHFALLSHDATEALVA